MDITAFMQSYEIYFSRKEIYPNVKMTFGYITKNNCISNNIEKAHSSDAYCISGNLNAKRNEEIFIQKFVRKNN